MKNRLDKELVVRDLAETRSQAENLIRLGRVKVDGEVIKKAGFFSKTESKIEIIGEQKYVSRAGLKLASVVRELSVDFADKIVLDVGSSTGGFTDFALQNGSKKIYAVDVGTDQMNPILATDSRIDLHEKTDIRDFYLETDLPDLILIDVSFISVKQILPHIVDNLVKQGTEIILMLKPQFEAKKNQLNKGIVKNNTHRRQIIKDFENYIKQDFKIIAKKDSLIAGKHGNVERFYLLKKI